MTTGDQVDFLAIGHICHDLAPGGKVIGGAAAYAAVIAQALGCRAAVVTSSDPADDWRQALPGIQIEQHPSGRTTTFENVYTPNGRVQTIHSVAGKLEAAHVPDTWLRAPMALVAPIANEVDGSVVDLLSNSLIGVEPQGWMRRWGDDGRIYAVPWGEAADILQLAAVTFMSAEDLAEPGLLADYRRAARLLVLTDGPNGCTVYCGDEERIFPAPSVHTVETTGAGDIFAAAYLIRLHQTAGDPWESARFANLVAAESVTQIGMAAKAEAVRARVAAMNRAGMGE